MIELAEALTLAKQLNDAIAGKTVERVLPPTKPHKFCWFCGDAADYEPRIKGARAVCARGFGIYCDIEFDNGQLLSINDGVNVRFVKAADAPRDRQLLIAFTDGTALVFTVAMYGGICLHGGVYDNEYYLSSLAYTLPTAPEFRELFFAKLAQAKQTLSAKAFLATEQRFPGIGNGTVQDILFEAGVNPKRKISTLDGASRERLFLSAVSVVGSMIENGGRDTEKDIYGESGGYVTRMSKNALSAGCPVCGGEITKEAYLGGSVYYCKKCQPL